MPSSASRPIDQLDGYLLRVLCTLVDERSVSRTALRIDQTQPAVSAALKRLREVFSDPLLVREKLGMVPTARALELAAQAGVALAEMNKLLVPAGRFDPAHAEQTYRVASPDYLDVSFLAAVAGRLRREAPNCRLEVHALGPDVDYETALAQDALDLVIGNWPNPPEHLHLSLLLEEPMVCLVRQGHALAQSHLLGLTEAAYLGAAHVVPMPYSRAQRGVVETHLAQRRLVRDARIVVPYFALAPHVVAHTDLVFTTARHFALTHARILPLTVLPAPPGFPRMRFYQLWHPRSHNAAAHRWLRQVIAEIGHTLSSPVDMPGQRA